ncbi:MAG: flagellar biosynthesis protein FlhA [Candidatus Firestonebacteria bacterium]|nr:flagellar biosynthesis protein FlhA [Candidatus Firestonebacteria bacterium]
MENVVSGASFFRKLSDPMDVAVSSSIVAILGIMIVPIPPILLDLLLTLSITFSLVILLVSMHTKRPLDFSAFPSVLLVVTLFRLSLNIAATRLILLNGHEGTSAAGQVISSFGQFVVGGNYIVGFTIFIILVIIQFIVITKGAGRIAEVSARFTLDAMPGKQMSIDADLNAGLIDETKARERRADIAREADFYGAMDGSSKFVRGDAIANILIIFINILGGLLIGVFEHNMEIMKALQIYSLLTIGGGLLSQIPALIVSTASGFLVTRAASDSNFSKDIISQLILKPKAISIASMMLVVLAVIPGLPKLPFFLLAIGGGYLAFKTNLREKNKKIEEDKKVSAIASQSTATEAEKIETFLNLDPIEVEVGYGLISIVDEKKGGDLLKRIRNIRKNIAMELGFIVPPIRIKDNIRLASNTYTVKIKGAEVSHYDVYINKLLAIKHGPGDKGLEGEETYEPAFGLKAFWINPNQKDHAQVMGYTIVDPTTVITTHLNEIVKSHAYELVGRQEVQHLLDNLKQTHPALLTDLIPNIFSIGVLQKVLCNLLKEQVSIRDIVTIMESMGDFIPKIKDLRLVTEYVRQSLGRNLCKPYLDKDGTLTLISLSNEIENIIMDALMEKDGMSYLMLDPTKAQQIISSIEEGLKQFYPEEGVKIILCSPQIRFHLRTLIERFIKNFVIISYSEIAPDIKVISLGNIKLENK